MDVPMWESTGEKTDLSEGDAKPTDDKAEEVHFVLLDFVSRTLSLTDGCCAVTSHAGIMNNPP